MGNPAVKTSMPTLGTGDCPQARAACLPMQRGFTLLELLLVVVILGVVVAASVQMTSVNSLSRLAQQHGQMLAKQLSLLCEKALFENRHLGVSFQQNGSQALQHNGLEWQQLDQDLLKGRDIPETTAQQVYVQGQALSLKEEVTLKPHIICYPSGQMSSFQWHLTGRDADVSWHYQVASEGPNRITQGWIDG